MGEINKKLFGKSAMTSAETLKHADMFCEVLKGLTPYDQYVVKDQRNLLVDCVHALGEKGATELLGKLGVWMVLHNVHSAQR